MRFNRIRATVVACGTVLVCFACSSSSGTSSSGGTPEGGTPISEAGATDTSMAADTSMAGNCAPACTGANITCDPADNKCKLDGTTTKIGGPCTTSGADPLCGSDSKATCGDKTNDGFPGGYCSFEPCSATQLCPIGSSCAALGGESDACFKNCTSDADCRGPDYKCLAVDPLFTSGASHKVCYLTVIPCANGLNADCPASFPKCTGPDGGDAGGGGTCK